MIHEEPPGATPRQKPRCLITNPAFGLPFSNNLRDNIGEAALKVHLEIPEDLARQLAADPSGVTHAALEAVALEGVRSGKFTVSQARRLLGIGSRYEMDGFLKTHGIFLDLTLDDVRKDSETALAPDPIDLRERGIDESQAADLRRRLAAFTEDWDRPEMAAYDELPPR
jgi:hypothetical protein